MDRASIPGQKRPRGRLIEKPMGERIPDSPKSIARAILHTPRKQTKDWKYLKETG